MNRFVGAASERTESGGVIRLVIMMTVLCIAVAVAQNYGEAQGAEARGASSGVFNLEQAERGAELFAARCAGCHGADLSGGFGPRLAPIGAHWQGQSVGALFRFVSSNMPYDDPGSLEQDQYLDVLSFVLQQNGYPVGDAALTADAAVNDALVLDEPPQ